MDTVTQLISDSVRTLEALLLRAPDDGETQRIISIRASEAGLDHLEITTKGETSSWKHRIYTEEV